MEDEQMMVDFLKTWWIAIMLGQLLCITIVLGLIQLSLRRILQRMKSSLIIPHQRVLLLDEFEL